jgi:RHS repeat-associated protein
MTNAAKAAVWDAAWLPWGGVHSITGAATLDARFPGQWFQLETGLHYNWHRSYDPSLGRYTQPDPLGFVDGPSVYGYVRGQPQSGVDPEGLAAQICAIPGMCTVIIPKIGREILRQCVNALKTQLSKDDPLDCKVREENSGRKRGKQDPISAVPVNPGRDCNGKCLPCPNDTSWEVDAPGHGAKRHGHSIRWNQNLLTCECFPKRTSYPLE